HGGQRNRACENNRATGHRAADCSPNGSRRSTIYGLEESMLNRMTACALVLTGLTLEGATSPPSRVRTFAPSHTAGGGQEPVTITRHDDERRVDVSIGGKPFTSYIYPATVKKPVLFPLRSAKGTIVTRGFPLEPRSGERADHPHQVGAWFTYGDVNGIDFWGYSNATPPEEVPGKGTIVHKAIIRTLSGADRGELAVA